MTVQRLEDLTRAELAVLVREYLLGGQMIDRAGMPHAISRFGREVMGEIAIEEWMGASPIYTRRTQRVLGFVGDSVETIFKGMQFDIGAPPEFMDFRYRVTDHDHGEFWLDHCGALMDVEPMGDDYVHTMCHTIEDPTFEATACAANPRARMTPLHRPPREPSDRHPHCHWQIEIVADAEPLAEPEPAVRLARTRLAALPLHEVVSADAADEGQGWDDYSAPLDTDLRAEQFSKAALEAVAAEVCVQWHLLAMAFFAAAERRSSTEEAIEMSARQFTGVAGLTAERLAAALGTGNGLVGIARVLELHPAFGPRSYVDWRIELTDGDQPELTVHLGDCEALRESGIDSWITILASGRADAALDAAVRAVEPRASAVSVEPADGAVASWSVEIGEHPAPEAADVALTKFSSGAGFAFSETPVALG